MQPTMMDMTPSALVLLSVTLGLVSGAALMAAIMLTRAAGKRRAAEMRPELPEIATSILDEIDLFAIILDSSLSPVYANPIARVEKYVTGDELQNPELLQRARQVMTTGIPDTRDPDPDNAADTVRIHIVRIERRFLVILAEDLGEEQRLNAMRRDFIANVSHELKTPVAAVGLLAEAVREAADEPVVVRDFAKSLIKESRRLGELSRDIIQLSEAQSTLRPEDREEVALASLVRNEVEAVREFAAQQNVEIALTDVTSVDGFDGLSANGRAAAEDPVIMGRPSSLSAAVSNLLSNAIRHSPDGGRIGVGMEVDRRMFSVTVTDQGEGIDPEQQDRIFERFYRIDGARSRGDGGTGLGLSIARHSMRAHGGDISLWSQPGVGSTFTLEFPLPQDLRRKSAKSKKRAKKSLQSVRVAGERLDGAQHTIAEQIPAKGHSA